MIARTGDPFTPPRGSVRSARLRSSPRQPRGDRLPEYDPEEARCQEERGKERKGKEWARAFTDHYATVTNYNDATVMRLLVQRVAFLPPGYWDR